MEIVDTVKDADEAENSFLFLVEDEWSGVRLDQFLVAQLPGFSRGQISTAIKTGAVVVDGEGRKSSYRLKAGQKVSGLITLPKVDSLAGEQIDFDILFEDEHLIALSKPPALVVHPGSGNPSGTLVNGLIHYCSDIMNAGDSSRPGIVHRLDKDTSGLMLVAKTDRAHRTLVECFKNHRLQKDYIALVHGLMSEKHGRIVASIGRHPVNRQKMAVLESGGRYAASNWQVIEELSGCFSLLKVNIETGRTHQIRVHMAHQGHPVAGDTLYGRKTSQMEFPRQMLHAYRLQFEHPVSKAKMNICAPLWPDFKMILEKLGWDGEGEIVC